MSSSLTTTTRVSAMSKKKLGGILLVVAIGHVCAFWGISHLQTQQSKLVAKKPIEVKFVKIMEPIAPKPAVEPPTKKVEPKPVVKPKPVVPQPKKEIKPIPPKPKKVDVVQHAKVVEATKKIQTVENLKSEPKAETKIVETPKPVEQKVQAPPEIVETPKPVAEEKPAPKAPEVPAPKKVSIGGSGVNWSRSPNFSYDAEDLQGTNRSVLVAIEANEKGKITSVKIIKGSGISALDEKVLRAVRGSKFKPYQLNGVAYPISAQQPFDLTL